MLLAALQWGICNQAVYAQRWFVEPSIAMRVTATDNAALGSFTDDREIFVGFRPKLILQGEAPGFHVAGAVAVDAVTYTQKTQDDVLLPQADVLARLTVVDRVFFLEGSVRASQNNVNPFGPRSGAESVDNTVTSSQYVLSPYIDSEPARGLHVRARSDNSRVGQNGSAASLSATTGTSSFGRHSASVEMEPRPLGWRVEAQRDHTTYQGQVLPIDLDVARASVNFAPDETASAGIRAGVERHNLFSGGYSGSIYGGQMVWRPTERTQLGFDAEHRFFGTAWHFNFSHRSPLLAWSLSASRDVGTTPQALLELPPTDNVAALLDSILTTRFPDPVDRAKQVQDVINARGLPPSIASAFSIVQERVSVQTGATAMLALLGSRSVLVINAYRRQLRDLVETGPLATDSANTNNRQIGTSLAYSRRLTPTVNAGLVVDFTQIEALALATTQGWTKQGALRADVSFRVASKSDLHVGAQYRRIASTVVVPGDETLVFVALSHTF